MNAREADVGPRRHARATTRPICRRTGDDPCFATDAMDTTTAWMFATRWGNSLLLLPVAACISLQLWSAGDRRVAARWAVWVGGAVILVLVTKLAFLGWGIGIRAVDFTGLSGHSTLAAAVLPMGAWWLTRERSVPAQRGAMAAGFLLAVIVGVSRVLLATHSVSEVVAGLCLGSAVAIVSIPREPASRAASVLRWAVLATLLVAGFVPDPGDADHAHDVVTTLALRLSGRTQVHDRATWLLEKAS